MAPWSGHRDSHRWLSPPRAAINGPCASRLLPGGGGQWGQQGSAGPGQVAPGLKISLVQINVWGCGLGIATHCNGRGHSWQDQPGQLITQHNRSMFWGSAAVVRPHSGHCGVGIMVSFAQIERCARWSFACWAAEIVGSALCLCGIQLAVSASQVFASSAHTAGDTATPQTL